MLKAILTIRHSRKNSIFCFKEVTIEEIETEIYKLSSKKASQNSDIPTRIVKEYAYNFADLLCKSINATSKSSMFSSSLKLADVTFLHEKRQKRFKRKL